LDHSLVITAYVLQGEEGDYTATEIRDCKRTWSADIKFLLTFGWGFPLTLTALVVEIGLGGDLAGVGAQLVRNRKRIIAVIYYKVNFDFLWMRLAIGGTGWLIAELYEYWWLITKVIVNTWEIHDFRVFDVFDIETLEQRLGANPRKLKDLRTVRGPGSENNALIDWVNLSRNKRSTLE